MGETSSQIQSPNLADWLRCWSQPPRTLVPAQPSGMNAFAVPGAWFGSGKENPAKLKSTRQDIVRRRGGLSFQVLLNLRLPQPNATPGQASCQTPIIRSLQSEGLAGKKKTHFFLTIRLTASSRGLFRAASMATNLGCSSAEADPLRASRRNRRRCSRTRP
jgi:hypothetical protein